MRIQQIQQIQIIMQDWQMPVVQGDVVSIDPRDIDMPVIN